MTLSESSKSWQEKYTLLGRASSSTKLSLIQTIALMIADLTIYMGTIILFYGFLTKTVLNPVHRGFSCNDPYIQNPVSSFWR
uniref:Uncharacterized protein n=1 Tax=Panagrolaimus sp. JU765 TaxID=591449 RepID=A0AC34RG48_9BILA